MSPSSPVLVVGATGRLGLEVVRRLRELSFPVRAVTRPGAAREPVDLFRGWGAETVDADLKAPDSMRLACQGVKCVVATATAMRSRVQGDSIGSVDDSGLIGLIESAERSSVERFVYVSFAALPVDFALQRAKRAVEGRLERSRMAVSLLRPVHFAEVWLSPLFGFDPMQGRARIFGDGTRALNWISIADVARFVVAAASGRLANGKSLTLGGPDALSQLDIVSLFRRLGAPPVTYEYVLETQLEDHARRAAEARDAVAEARAALALTVARGLVVDTRKALDALADPFVSAEFYVSN